MLETRRFRRARRRAPSILLVACAALSAMLAASACAPPRQNAGPSRVSTLGVGTARADAAPLIELRHEAAIGETTMPASAAEIWGVLGEVFEQLGIDASQVDASAGIYGTESLQLRSIEGVRLSRWLDCGMGAVQANADAHQVTLSLMVQLLPGTAGTTVRSTVDAYARDRSQSGGTVHCISRGRLERRIPELIGERLGFEI